MLRLDNLGHDFGVLERLEKVIGIGQRTEGPVAGKEGDGSHTQPGQEISSRGWGDGIQRDDETGCDDDNEFGKQGHEVSAVQTHRDGPWVQVGD